jgi:hypothetical protein
VDYASLFWGGLVGALSSWWITHRYYEKSSKDLGRDLSRVTGELKAQNSIDYFVVLLRRREDWSKGFVDNTEIWTNSRNGTFQIVIGNDSRTFDEPWSRGFPDPNSRCFSVYLRIGGATIKELQFVALDGARITVPCPEHILVDEKVVYLWNTDSVAFAVGKVVGDYYIYSDIESVARRCKVEILKANEYSNTNKTVA